MLEENESKDIEINDQPAETAAPEPAAEPESTPAEEPVEELSEGPSEEPSAEPAETEAAPEPSEDAPAAEEAQTEPEGETPEGEGAEAVSEGEVPTEEAATETPAAEAPVSETPARRRDPDYERIEKTVRVTRTVNFVLMGVLLLVVVALGVITFLAANGYLYGKVLGDPANGQIDAAAVAQQSMPAIVIVENATRTGSALGTGFLFREDGYILTNAHVMENSLSVQVEFRDGRKVPATLVGMRTLEDVAVLKIEGTGYPTLPLGKSSEVMAGESIIAIGTAGSKQYAFTVTRGIVSCPDREVKIYDTSGTLSKKATMVQFDANATNGNSGGPLINARGQVIGIVTLKANATSVDYLNMAIPITGAVELAETMIREGGNAEQVTTSLAESRPLLGVVAYTYGVQADGKYCLVANDKGNVSPVMLAELDEGGQTRYCYYTDELGEGESGELETGDSKYKGYYRVYVDEDRIFVPGADGVLILSVTEGYDAEGKLEALDVVTEINGRSVGSVSEVAAILNELHGGDTVTVKFYRQGLGERTVDITLGNAQPED